VATPRRRAVLALVGLTAAVVTTRLPSLTAPLTSDEGGFLLIASQWGPGRSLYGDYWVDRPPLLLAFFALADRLGGAVGLRGLGLAAVVCAILAAAAVGALTAGRAARRRVAVMCAATAAVFLATPLFGTDEVNGELVATPLVLVGLALLLLALRRPAGLTRAGYLLCAGGLGAAAVLVKQNEWDVFVVVTAFAVAGATHRTKGDSRLGTRDVLAVASGAALVGVVVVLAAAALGTAPSALWDAVVQFRVDASQVLGRSASSATPHRLLRLALALLVSGAPLVLALLLRRIRRPPAAGSPDLRAPAVAVLAWELFVVLAGGSYWLHYLIVLVPGLVLSVAVLETSHSPPGPARRTATGPVLAWAAAVCAVALAWTTLHPGPPRGPTTLVTWLIAHTEEGDDAVIAYGQPQILQAAGLASPYPDLWSLPVRVHDPRLESFAALLAGDRAPDWVIVTGGDLQTWGIDATAGTAALRARYSPVTEVDGYEIYRRNSTR